MTNNCTAAFMNDLPYLVISIDEKPNLEYGLNLDKTYVYCDPGFATGPAGVTAMFAFVFIMQACISRSSRPGNATFSFIRMYCIYLYPDEINYLSIYLYVRHANA